MQIYDLSASMHVYSSGCNSHYQGLTNASGKKNIQVSVAGIIVYTYIYTRRSETSISLESLRQT